MAALIPFDDPDEALGWANDTDYGLAASVWTQDLSQAHQVVDAIKAGMVWVHGHCCFSPELSRAVGTTSVAGAWKTMPKGSTVISKPRRSA